jgi:hypothetical protein
MSDEGTAGRAQDLARQSEQARSWSTRLRAEAIEVAEQVVETEETVAGTLARLASQYPQHASRLQAKIKAAEAYAAWTRDRVNALQAARPHQTTAERA